MTDVTTAMVEAGQAICDEMLSAQIAATMGGVGGSSTDLSKYSDLALRYVNEEDTTSVEIIYLAMRAVEEWDK